MTNLLLKVATFMEGVGDIDEGLIGDAYASFKNVAEIVLPVVIAVILVIGAFFGISLGIKFAKAEDTDAREKAKGQLINLAIGIGVAAVIMVVCFALVKSDALATLFDGALGDTGTGGEGSGEGTEGALRILGL